MRGPSVPRGVGYWGAGEMLALPRPQSLVRPGWHAEDRRRIFDYLRGGVVCWASPGLACCRFAPCAKTLGSCELSDGEWVWPQGLEHYVGAHEVCLPEAFVETMQANGWRVPPDVDLSAVQGALEEAGQLFGDLSYWLE